MGAVQVLDALVRDPTFRAGVALDHLVPARQASYAEIPAQVPERLRAGLTARGLQRLYSHQAEVFLNAVSGRDTVVVTPTSSGKTLRYSVPVLSRILQRPAARALSMLPTTALAQDQSSELTEPRAHLNAGTRTYTSDGA